MEDHNPPGSIQVEGQRAGSGILREGMRGKSEKEKSNKNKYSLTQTKIPKHIKRNLLGERDGLEINHQIRKFLKFPLEICERV